MKVFELIDYLSKLEQSSNVSVYKGYVMESGDSYGEITEIAEEPVGYDGMNVVYEVFIK